MKRIVLLSVVLAFTLNVLGQVTDTGNEVGIGNTNPSQKLNVQGDFIGFPVASGTNQTYGIYRIESTQTNSILDFGLNGGSEASSWIQATNRTSLGTNYKLLLNPNGGNVGIGTTNPNYALLHLNRNSFGESSMLSFSVKDGTYNPRIYFKHHTSETNQYLEFTSTFSTQVGYADYIFSNGNMGIGTIDPNYKLEIVGDGTNLALKNETQSMTEEGLLNTIRGLDKDNNVLWYLGDGSSTKRVLLTARGDGTYPLDFEVNSQTRMRIATNGFVGIGTIDPNTPIHIYNSTNNTIFKGESGDPYVLMNLKDNTTSGSGYFVSRSGDNTYFYTADNARMTLLGNGNIGIGTTSPIYKLSVKGTIGCGEVIVENVTGWADFVFEDDYHLMPLQELDSYIQENKHLPEIPTAEEVQENGISVGEMNAKLLQKIEELTLHTIEQQKIIESLLNRVENLENK